MNINDYHNNVARKRISENRDLTNGLRLNRNEKVGPWPTNILKSIFDDVSDNILSIYPDIESFSVKLSEHLEIQDRELLITNGIDGGIKIIWDVLTSPGDCVGVLSPTYAMYGIYSEIYQTNLMEIEYKKDFSLDINKIYEFIEQNPSVLFIPNPNQPIESCLSVNEIEALCVAASQYQTFIVIDEAYHMFGSESAKSLVNKYDNLIILQGFSKGYGLPSIRLGYLISNQNNVQVLSYNRNAYETNSLSMVVAGYFMDNYKIVTDYNNGIITARDNLRVRLNDAGINSKGRYGNFLLIDLETTDKCNFVFSYLFDHKIYVKGEFNGELSKYILITIGTMLQMNDFYDILMDAISDYNSAN